jgi:hypothetical protein
MPQPDTARLIDLHGGRFGYDQICNQVDETNVVLQGRWLFVDHWGAVTVCHALAGNGHRVIAFDKHGSRTVPPDYTPERGPGYAPEVAYRRRSAELRVR